MGARVLADGSLGQAAAAVAQQLQQVQQQQAAMMQFISGGASVGVAKPWGGRSTTLSRLPSIAWSAGDLPGASSTDGLEVGAQLQLPSHLE
eukprot:14646040-Alexandrium_andersonii.AAC.1